MGKPDIIIKNYDELTLDELYEILRSRQEVFALEQGIIYQDLDLIDRNSLHIFMKDELKKEIVAYLRLIEPGVKYPEVSMGRLLTLKEHRGKGYGRQLMCAGIREAEKLYGEGTIRIEAQAYLLQFYESLGFKAVRGPFILEGIEHIEMIRIKDKDLPA